MFGFVICVLARVFIFPTNVFKYCCLSVAFLMCVNCNKQLAMNINGFVNEELPTPYHVDVISYNELDNDNLKEHVNRIGEIFYKKKA